MTHFNIIGIRPLMPKPLEENPVRADKMQAIQKALWNKNVWHYFYQGYTIADDHSFVDITQEASKDYSLYDTENLKVSICAIVGKNGSGKSSIVDLLIRLINNLSAVLLGEKINFAAAEHLHFIDYVYAELAFRIGNTIYVLEERGRFITLHKFNRGQRTGNRFFLTDSEVLLHEKTTPETTLELLKKHKKGRVILKSLFYTLVCNYSLYGFNYRDYFEEATPIGRLLKLYKKEGELKMDELAEDHLWLKGIFHKNDGYQTPIVLHPMRHDGHLDISKENHLAKERMCNLLFYKDATGNYPQRIINGNLNIIAFKLKPSVNKKFARENMLKHIGIGKQQNIYLNFDNIYNWILQFWNDKYHFLQNVHKGKLRDEACDYIVYKTLKIVSSYKKYHFIYNYLSRSIASFEELREKMESLSEDFTHITKKLLRAIMYLKKDLYPNPDNNYNLKILDDNLTQYVGEQIHPKYKLQAIDLLPPPIFDQTLYLAKNGEGGLIDFRNLSSGEKQIAYTISNFMYHLVNVDSEWNDFFHDKAHAKIIKYRYVNVIFDEVELYFHPELQRSFLGLIQQALQNAHFRNLRGVNIMLATHSPFILSDIPHSNVLCLGEEKPTVSGTFGANIIELLGNSFFLSSVIGNVASIEIKKVVEMYQSMKAGVDISSKYQLAEERFRYLNEYISDPYMKMMTERMIDELNDYNLKQKKNV